MKLTRAAELLCVVLVAGTDALQFNSAAARRHGSVHHGRQSRLLAGPRARSSIRAAGGNEPSDEDKYKYQPSEGMGERKGFYVRPSKAIEQGGGFFVPGLEETWKIQVGVSLIVLFLLLTNRFPWVYEPSGPQLISEGVGLIAALSLLGGGVLGSGVFDGFLGGGEVDGSGGGGASASGGDNTSGVGFGRVSFAAPELEARDLAAAENCLWAGNALLDLTNSQAALLLDSTGRPMACVGEYERSHAWFSDSQALSGRAVEFEFVGGGAVQLDANDAGRSGLRELLPSGCAFVASQGGGEGGWLVASPAKGRWSARQMGWLESIAGFTKEQLGE